MSNAVIDKVYIFSYYQTLTPEPADPKRRFQATRRGWGDKLRPSEALSIPPVLTNHMKMRKKCVKGCN